MTKQKLPVEEMQEALKDLARELSKHSGTEKIVTEAETLIKKGDKLSR